MSGIQNRKLLISVVVVTYNSSRYVIETLESVKNQTYSYIELIITDDKSTDDTVEICSKWLEENRRRFVNVRIISSDINTGITKNRNRGCFAANGVWIKQIDGDDRLLPTCISDYVTYANLYADKNMIFSPLSLIGEGELAKWRAIMKSNYEYAFRLSKRDFKILLCKVCIFGAPSLFIKTDFFKQLKGYDESIPMLEDWPFWVRSAFNGAKFAFIDKPEVEYRISEYSLSQGIGERENMYHESLRQVEKKTLSFMKQISLLYWIEGYLCYKKRYECNLLWNLVSYARPLNPYFWKVRKLYKDYKRN